MHGHMNVKFHCSFPTKYTRSNAEFISKHVSYVHSENTRCTLNT